MGESRRRERLRAAWRRGRAQAAARLPGPAATALILLRPPLRGVPPTGRALLQPVVAALAAASLVALAAIAAGALGLLLLVSLLAYIILSQVLGIEFDLRVPR